MAGAVSVLELVVASVVDFEYIISKRKSCDADPKSSMQMFLETHMKEGNKLVDQDRYV